MGLLPAFLLLTFAAQAQTGPLTIDSCYRLAKENYPLIKKQDLISKSSGYSLENAARFFLPQVTVSGQASYQSQTIDFRDVLPGVPAGSLPNISKDQYRIQAEVSQQI
ncbi:MAG TPA: TolC family protein, partial [Puia sp.]